MPWRYFDILIFPKTSPGKKALGKTWNEEVARDAFGDLRKHIKKKSGAPGPFRIWMDNDPAWRGKPGEGKILRRWEIGDPSVRNDTLFMEQDYLGLGGILGLLGARASNFFTH